MKLNNLTSILREEYKGIGYIPADALEALRSDRDTDNFYEYRDAAKITATQLNVAVRELENELIAETNNTHIKA